MNHMPYNTEFDEMLKYYLPDGEIKYRLEKKLDEYDSNIDELNETVNNLEKKVYTLQELFFDVLEDIEYFDVDDDPKREQLFNKVKEKLKGVESHAID